MTFQVSGGQGGKSGGQGGRVTGTLTQIPSTLYIAVAGAGITGNSAAGGFNGGGAAGSGSNNEGSGGGSSDIRLYPLLLEQKHLVQSFLLQLPVELLVFAPPLAASVVAVA